MARRGRPRKQGKRERSGRLIRKTPFETQAEILEVAMAKRLQMGIPEHLARSVGTPEALLWEAYRATVDPETGKGDRSVGICRDQYDAAVYYQVCRMEFFAAVEDRNTPQQPRTRMSSGDEDAHTKFCQRAIERWNEMRNRIQVRQNALGSASNLFAALDGLANNNVMTYQIGDLREALNEIHNYRTSRKKRAA